MARILVVGAGPAGAALAYLLARRGAEVLLLERQSDFAREFRGEILMPSGLEALRQMGLGPRLDAMPAALPGHLDVHLNGHFVRRLSLPELIGDGPRMLSQPVLLEALVEEASAFPGFEVRRGVTVSDLLREGDRVVGVALRGGGEERADLVIGCDGRASRLRARSSLDTEKPRERFDVVWFKVPVPPPPSLPDAIHVHLRPGQLCLAVPSFDDRLQVGWVIGKGSYGDLKRSGQGAWLDAIASQVDPVLGEHLRAHADALEHPFVLDVVCFALERWHEPGLLLLGDAAHPMSPVGGQGLNVALRDAVVAANHLVPALLGEARDGGVQGSDAALADALGAAAEAIQRERMPEIRTLQRFQRRPPQVFLGRPWWVRPVLGLTALALRSGLATRLAGDGRRLPAITDAFLHGVSPVELRV